MKRLDHYWYSQNPLAWVLWPLSLLFCALAGLRRFLYRRGVFKTYRAPVPVIIVGNISVGGTGKTPLIVYLCRYLQRRGLRPGVISRGYGGVAEHYPLSVHGNSDPLQAGDEPVLIAVRCDCPVVVGPDRRRDVEYLLSEHPVDVILADDGMQHYRLARDAEIAVMDAARMLGNGFCLPAGPLRETAARLKQVDLVMYNGGDSQQPSFQLQARELLPMSGESCSSRLDALRGSRVHALAGIGHPQRFFNMLREQGIDCIEHVFDDHHVYRREELLFGDGLPVLMTEKDAVKCAGFSLPDHYYYLPVDAVLSAPAEQAIDRIIQQVCNG